MRIMRYFIALAKEKGYVISNADTTWDTIPTQKNLNNPPLRINSVTSASGKPTDLAEHAEVGQVKLENVSPEFETEHANFEANYTLALRGELKGWKLVGVRVEDFYISMIYAFREFHEYRFVYLSPGDEGIRIMFETERYDGGIDKYLLEAREEEGCCRYLQVTEYESRGYRELHFTAEQPNMYHNPDLDKEYSYIEVIEYR